MACRNRVYTANEVVRLLNNTDYESFDSDSEFESSSDESDSDSVDNIECESGSDSDSDATIIVDEVDDVTWSSSPVSNMRRLDFTGITQDCIIIIIIRQLIRRRNMSIKSLQGRMSHCRTLLIHWNTSNLS